MDRRPDPTDELYDFAREAYACADYDQAVYFLRKASSLAPMRQDIRQFLAEVLAKSGSGDTTPLVVESRQPGFRPAPVEMLQQGSQQVDLAPPVESRASTVSAFFHQPLRRLMERLPVKPLFGAPEEEDEESSSEPESARIEPIAPAAPRATVLDARPAKPDPLDIPAAADDVDRMSFPRPQPRSDFASSRRKETESFADPDDSAFPLPVFERDTAPASIPDWSEAPAREMTTPAAPVKRERTRLPKATRPPVTPVLPVSEKPEPPGEPVTTELPPPAAGATTTAAEWLATLPPPSRRVIAFSCAYATVALFVAVACTQCYSKFYRLPNSVPAAPAVVALADSAAPAAVAPAAAAAPARTADALSLPTATVPTVTPSKPQVDYGAKTREALRSGRLEEAAGLLKSHAAEIGSEQKTLRAQLASAFDREGTEHLKESRFSSAIENYAKAFGFASSNSSYATHLGNAYYYYATKRVKGTAAREQLQKAVEVLQRAVELDRESVEAYHRLATCYEQLGKNSEAQATWTKALAVLNQSLKTDGRKIETYQRIAMVCECLGRKSERRDAYKAILQLARPGSSAAVSAEKELKALGKAN